MMDSGHFAGDTIKENTEKLMDRWNSLKVFIQIEITDFTLVYK